MVKMVKVQLIFACNVIYSEVIDESTKDIVPKILTLYINYFVTK
jgi:hypothetical protein